MRVMFSSCSLTHNGGGCCGCLSLAPLQTGFMFMEGRQGDGHAGGTHTGGNAEKCWGRQQLVTSSGFTKRWVGVG